MPLSMQERTFRKIRAEKTPEAWLIAADFLDDMDRHEEAVAMRNCALFMGHLQRIVLEWEANAPVVSATFEVAGRKYRARLWGGKRITCVSLTCDGEHLLARSDFERARLSKPGYLFRKCREIAAKHAGLVVGPLRKEGK